MKFLPYLNFDGTCAEAFRFYEKVFNGKIEAMMTFEETPMAAEEGMDGWQGRIMHACLSVGDSLLMASDSPVGRYEVPRGLWVSIGLKEVAEGERVFRELSEGGQVVMPYEKTFWSPGFGMVNDRFGTPWMINVEMECPE